MIKTFVKTKYIIAAAWFIGFGGFKDTVNAKKATHHDREKAEAREVALYDLDLAEKKFSHLKRRTLSRIRRANKRKHPLPGSMQGYSRTVRKTPAKDDKEKLLQAIDIAEKKTAHVKRRIMRQKQATQGHGEQPLGWRQRRALQKRIRQKSLWVDDKPHNITLKSMD